MTLSADLPAPGTALPLAPLTWNDPARGQAFSRWLSSLAAPLGLVPASVRLASADASFRRYFRINTHDGGSRIIMDAPPALENAQPFVAVAQLMHDAGLRAPQVLAWAEADGFMLLSDLGSHTMMDVIKQHHITEAPAKGGAVHRLYMQAVDALLTWQLASRPGVLPAYDDALLSRELQLFPDWYLAQYRGISITPALNAQLQDVFAQIKSSNLNALGGARVFVHRDFMPRNLMAPTPGSGESALPPAEALGVLDFQDAVYGPITYDIASLMRDAFLSWDEAFVLDITVRYWQQARQAGLPVGNDFGEFYRAVEWMGLQRHLKILGIFARLTLRDGKPQYLADTPRFIRYVRTTADRYRSLGPFLKLLDQIEGITPQVGFAYGRV